MQSAHIKRAPIVLSLAVTATMLAGCTQGDLLFLPIKIAAEAIVYAATDSDSATTGETYATQERETIATDTSSSGTAGSMNPPASAGIAASTRPRLVVTPEIKSKIENFVRSCESSSIRYCVIAVRNDGTKAGLGKGDTYFTSHIERARKTAMSGCGSASECVVVYDGGTMRVDIASP